MGLMKFLAAGRSLDRIGDEPSRYRMDQRGLLPKFGSPDRDRRLAWPRARTAGDRADAGGTEFARGSRAEVARGLAPGASASRATPAGAGVDVPKMIPTVNTDPSNMKASEKKIAATVAPAEPGQPARPARRWFQGRRWSLFKNPFAGRGPARPVKAPVQCELSLDAVKPVRNDLSDSDLDVVAGSSKAAASIAPVDPVAPSGTVRVPAVGPGRAQPPALVSSGPVWGRIKNQYFGTGKI